VAQKKNISPYLNKCQSEWATVVDTVLLEAAVIFLMKL